MFRRWVVIPAVVASFGLPVPASSDESDVEKYVASIQSSQQVKNRIRSALTADCGTGSCLNNNATEICSLLGALALRSDGLISNTVPGYRGKPEVPITNADLALFKKIWRNCRPTTYQYWNYGTVLHVAYDAPPQEDEEIRRALGIATGPSSGNAAPKAQSTTAPQVTAPPERLLAPLEPNVVMLEEHKTNTGALNSLVHLVRSNGFKCDSISAMRPFLTSRGFTLTCNRFDYQYEIEDKGGNWKVTVK